MIIIMDLLAYSISTVILAAIISKLFNHYYSRITRLPPGPTKLPVIGNLHNLIGASPPHHTLRRLSREHGPLMHLQLGESSTLVVSSAELARDCMRTNDLSFADRPKLVAIEVCSGSCDNVSFAPYGQYWRQMRKLCVVELLSNKRVASFSSVREEEVLSLLRSIFRSSSSSGAVNLTEGLLGLMSRVVSRAAFGSKYDVESAASLASKFKESIRLAAGFGIADLYPSLKILRALSPSLARAKKLHAEIDGALQRMIDEHDSETLAGTGIEEDLVDVLLRLRRSGGLEIPITMKHIKATLSVRIYVILVWKFSYYLQVLPFFVRKFSIK